MKSAKLFQCPEKMFSTFEKSDFVVILSAEEKLKGSLHSLWNLLTIYIIFVDRKMLRRLCASSFSFLPLTSFTPPSPPPPPTYLAWDKSVSKPIRNWPATTKRFISSKSFQRAAAAIDWFYLAKLMTCKWECVFRSDTHKLFLSEVRGFVMIH